MTDDDPPKRPPRRPRSEPKPGTEPKQPVADPKQPVADPKQPVADPKQPVAAPDTAAPSIDTAPTAEPRQPGPSVEVSPDAYAPVPTADLPSGDMRPLDTAAQVPDVRTFEAAAHPSEPSAANRTTAAGIGAGSPWSVDYVPTPVPFDAPTQPTGPAAASAGDEPILPAAYDENALRDAVGAPFAKPFSKAKRKKREPVDDDGLPRPAGKRTIAIVALAIIVGLTVAGFVLLGRVNTARFLIECSATQVTAEQGRAFPPWGSNPLSGPEWKPIALPANAECKPRETDDRAELERWFLELLLDRASTTLTARDLLESVQADKPNPLDVAAAHLNQALLLSRAPERRDQRKEVERLLGDVQYWRATLRLRDASAALLDASRQFDAAAAQRPRHVTDSGEWASFLRRLTDELQAGPGGVLGAPTAPAAPNGEGPTAPIGTALPVEPDGSASEPPAAPPPDAGLPTGGVLL